MLIDKCVEVTKKPPKGGLNTKMSRDFAVSAYFPAGTDIKLKFSFEHNIDSQPNYSIAGNKSHDLC